MAALTLSIICVILARLGRNFWPVAIPLCFVLVMSFWALGSQLLGFVEDQNWLLLVLDVIILIAAVWVTIEAAGALRRARAEGPDSAEAHENPHTTLAQDTSGEATGEAVRTP